MTGPAESSGACKEGFSTDCDDAVDDLARKKDVLCSGPTEAGTKIWF